MTRPVVVTYDGSASSRRAFPLATELARRMGTPLHVVRAHVFSVPSMEPQILPPYEPDFLTALVTYEKADLESVRIDLAASGVETHADLLELGLVIPQLRDYVTTNHAAWVVTTTHGRGGFSRVWLGSVATGLIRESAAPVLVVPITEKETDAPRTIRHILLALDGSTHAEAVIAPAMSVARAFDAQLTLFQSAFSEAESAEAIRYLHNMARMVAEQGRHAIVQTRTSVLPAATNIVEAAHDLGCDLIAMCTHGRGFWSRAVIGSVADKVLRTSDIPMLIQHGGTD